MAVVQPRSGGGLPSGTDFLQNGGE
jgi:hypothetical protein